VLNSRQTQQSNEDKLSSVSSVRAYTQRRQTLDKEIHRNIATATVILQRKCKNEPAAQPCTRTLPTMYVKMPIISLLFSVGAHTHDGGTCQSIY
jgi:hypothetical protein